MKTISRRKAYCLIIASMLLASCAGGPKPKPTTEAEMSAPSDQTTEMNTPQELGALEKVQLEKAARDIDAGKFDIAKKSLQQLRKKAPPNSLVLSNLAALSYEEGNMEEALKLCASALKLDKTNPQAFNIAGLAHIGSGEIKKAEEAFIKALSSNSEYANAHYNLALVHDIYYQDLPSAVKHYQAYLTLTDFTDKKTLEWVQELERNLLTSQE